VCRRLSVDNSGKASGVNVLNTVPQLRL
jgi:hypothetical protein